MTFTTAFIADCLAGIFALFFLYRLWNRPASHLPFAPGPRGLPVVGNLFDVPDKEKWLAYWDMSRKYGSDCIHLRIGGTHYLILNSAKAAEDLFVLRGGIYADRPRFPMINELLGWTWDFTFRPYGAEWKKSRTLFQRHVQGLFLSSHFKPAIKTSTHSFLRKLLISPDAHLQHIRHMAGETLLSVAYGIQIQEENDPFVLLEERALLSLASAVSTGFLVDNFPFLKYLPSWAPGAGFKRMAMTERDVVRSLPQATMDFAEHAMADGTALPSIASHYVEQIQADGNWSEKEKKRITDVLGVMYSAGADTIVPVIHTVILALVQHPEIMKKGQAAVDAVVGLARLPSFSDEGQIPYVNAIVREALRWRPISPLSISHANVTADVYKGYYIPANTSVIGNSWAILHDATTYGADADEFRPERFLNADGSLNATVPYPDATFGFGRRICPGRFLAESVIWFAVVSLLACFDVEKAVRDGRVVEPSGESTDGLVCYPVPFECSIKARSSVVEALLEDTVL